MAHNARLPFFVRFLPPIAARFETAMLRVLRRHAQSPFIQLIVVVIAVVFIFWGVGTNLNSNADAVAVVDGKEITGVEFGRAYDQLLESYKRQFGGQLPEELINTLGIKQQAVNGLVQQELVRKGAGQLGLVISDQEVQRVIEGLSAFQSGGAFDLNTYRAVLARERLSTTAFEEGLRNDLLEQRVREAFAGFAQVSDEEIRQWLDYSNLQLQLRYALLSRTSFQDQVQADDKALAAWYDANKEQYRPAAEYKFDYLFFPFAADMGEVQVSGEEKRAYFDEHASQWQVPEQRHVRHILFRTTQDSSAEERAAKKEAAQQALSLLRGGGDFAELADSLTEDPSGKGRGGDLGSIARGQMVPAFEEAAFSLAPGALSEVVESPFGFHLIKVESVQPAVEPNFEKKEKEINEILTQQKVRGITFKKASSAYEGVIRAGSLNKFSADKGQKLESTDYVSQQAVPQQYALLHDAAIAKPAFSLGKGELSSIVEGKEGYAILLVNDIKTPQIPALDAIRERVLADYTREKSAELLRQAADAALRSLQEKDQWPEGLALKTTAFVKRSDMHADVPALVLQDAFSQLGKKRLPDAPLAVGEDLAVYQITGLQQGEGNDAETLRDTLGQQLLQARQNQLFARWLGELRAQSDVWINPDLLK